MLGWLESHTGVRKVYIASFLLLLLLLLVFRGTGMGCVSVLVGFLYPLHMSLKTIENCTSLFEQITGENRNKHTEEQIREKRGEIIGQLRQWSSHTHALEQRGRPAATAWSRSAVRSLTHCNVCVRVVCMCRLVYWVVYGLFNTLETLSDTALSWLPVYHPVKLLFLLWCSLPQYQGERADGQREREREGRHGQRHARTRMLTGSVDR